MDLRPRSPRVLALLAATLLLSVAVGSASANRLSLSNRLFRLTWSALEFVHEGGGTNPHVTCAVTLEGSFHSATIRKTRGALIGHVTRGIVKNETCTNGHVTILRESLPWEVSYEFFRGALPNITGIGIAIHEVTIQDEYNILGRFICLYTDRGMATEELAKFEIARAVGGALTTITPNNLIRLTQVSGTTGCPPRIGFERPGEVFLLGNTSRISLTLI
jgi:hypothetical protein